MNVLSKILIPRISASIRYILSELEESEREEIFRLKRVKQKKIKAAAREIGAGENTKVTDIPSEARETGDDLKTPQESQNLKPPEGLKSEDIEMKKDLQNFVEDAMQLTKARAPEEDQLLMSPNALTTVLQTEESEETSDNESETSSDVAVALQESSNLETESSEYRTPTIKTEDYIKFIQESISEQEESPKMVLDGDNELLETQPVDPAHTNGSVETSSQTEVSESSDENESCISSFKQAQDSKLLSSIRPNDASLEASNRSNLSLGRGVGENNIAAKLEPITSDEDVKKAQMDITEGNLEQTEPSTNTKEVPPSDISSGISQLETRKLFEEAGSPDFVSNDNLSEVKPTLKTAEDSSLPVEKVKDTSIQTLPEVPKIEGVKSKSSVRIKLPEDHKYEESQSRSDEKSPIVLLDIKPKGSEEVKEPVETQEKMTEGSVEKLGEGDSQMYTSQDRNMPNKTEEHGGSVAGIVDAEPYFETADAVKPSVSGPEGVPEKKNAESDQREDYDYDVELDETDIDINASSVPHSSRKDESVKKEEVEEAELEETDEARDDKEKPSRPPDDKKQ